MQYKVGILVDYLRKCYLFKNMQDTRNYLIVITRNIEMLSYHMFILPLYLHLYIPVISINHS